MGILRRTTSAPPKLAWTPLWWRRFRFACSVVAWLVRLPFRVGAWCWRHREGLTIAAVVGGAWVTVDVLGRRSLPLIVLALAACLWSYFQPCSGRRWLLARWRRFWVYRRHWQPACVLAGLSYGGRLPVLRRVEIDGALDVVHCRMLPGQVAERWHDQRDYLAQVFGAASCRVLAVGGRSPLLVLEFAVPGRARTPGDGEGW